MRPSSEDKDLDELMSGYWNAGVPEDGMIDARKNPSRFEVDKHGSKGYSPSRHAATPPGG